MKEITGDLWAQKGWKVITCNGTWNSRGEAVMGRGVALEAKKRNPWLPLALGQRLQKYGNQVYVFEGGGDVDYVPTESPGEYEFGLLTLPVKRHWRDRGDPHLIRMQLSLLVRICNAKELDPVFMVRPGCGNGGLTWEPDLAAVRAHEERQVVFELRRDGIRAMCQRILGDGDRFTIVERE